MFEIEACETCPGRRATEILGSSIPSRLDSLGIRVRVRASETPCPQESPAHPSVAQSSLCSDQGRVPTDAKSEATDTVLGFSGPLPLRVMFNSSQVRRMSPVPFLHASLCTVASSAGSMPAASTTGAVRTTNEAGRAGTALPGKSREQTEMWDVVNKNDPVPAQRIRGASKNLTDCRLAWQSFMFCRVCCRGV